ncbi:hypothetical protein E2562_019053 [Oryza meyeriana var. granulata]|uniref:Uncharacterized protein n=1 Tax=Oryza meyeriana var. granulata TaxID=110450 RepID=A0A6G1EN15_9ORYZ|nr:hypothetical protein E2562_019053 [Oryza meyeriana var. granulata]
MTAMQPIVAASGDGDKIQANERRHNADNAGENLVSGETMRLKLECHNSLSAMPQAMMLMLELQANESC